MVSSLGSEQALTNVGYHSHHRGSRSQYFLMEGLLLGQVASFSQSAVVGLGRGEVLRSVGTHPKDEKAARQPVSRILYHR